MEYLVLGSPSCCKQSENWIKYVQQIHACPLFLGRGQWAVRNCNCWKKWHSRSESHDHSGVSLRDKVSDYGALSWNPSKVWQCLWAKEEEISWSRSAGQLEQNLWNRTQKRKKGGGPEVLGVGFPQVLDRESWAVIAQGETAWGLSESGHNEVESATEMLDTGQYQRIL